MKSNLNSMLAAYEALPDKATIHARDLIALVAREAEKVRAEVKRMILAIDRAERWSLSWLDIQLSALDATPMEELERYRYAMRQEYEMASRVLM